MNFIERIQKIASPHVGSQGEITGLGTLRQFHSVIRKGNAVLADESWIPVAEKHQGKTVTKDWRVISYILDGEERVSCVPPTVGEGWIEVH